MAEDDDDLAAAIAMSMKGGSQDPPTVESAANRLRTNTPAALAASGTLQILKTLLSNLVKEPGEEKFRRVKLTNAKISKALSSPGAEEMLVSAGFVRSGEALEVRAELAGEGLSGLARAALEALDSCGGRLLSAQLRVEGAVRSVCALPDGGLASGSMDNAVRVYPPAGDWTAPPQVLAGHESRAGVSGVLALTAEVENADLVSAGRDGKIIAWRDGEVRATLTGHGEGITGTNVHTISCLGCRADGAMLSGGWDKTVRVWEGGAETSKMESHSIGVNSVVGLPNGDVASGSGDQTIIIWRESQQLRTLEAGSPVRSMVGCGGAILASGTNDGVVKLWNADSGHKLAEVKVGDSYILSLAYCPATSELAAGADDGVLAIIAVEGASLRITETLRHCGEVYGVAFLESGDLAAGCGNNCCVIWTKSSSRAAATSVQEEFHSSARALAAAQAGSAPAASPGGAAPGGSWDFSFPVDFGSSKMTISWNRGEDTQLIAQRFIAQNGLHAGHMGDVVAFVMHAQQQAASGGGAGATAGGGAGGGGFEFNYPVEVADGRRLMIRWNRGDDPQQVAMAFAQQNGMIGQDELPDIVNFIRQVSGGPAAPVAQVAPAISPAVQQQALMQVMEMGFDETTARRALETAGWSVEAAIQRLLG